jgi:hypothetical protein
MVIGYVGRSKCTHPFHGHTVVVSDGLSMDVLTDVGGK